MNSIIWKLGQYLQTQKSSYHSHYYRYRSLLKAPCKSFHPCHWLQTSEQIRLAERLAANGPLEISDLDRPSEARILRRWADLPKDPKFYAMALAQLKTWKIFADRSISDFLLSPEGAEWMSARKKLKRKSLFELDRIFKTTKKESLEREKKVRSLIRQNPFITYSDLRHLGVQNVQAIWERFPQRDVHRERALQGLLRTPVASRLSRKGR